MITDRIKFKPGYAKADSKSYADAGLVVKDVTPERLWRNLCNISIWPRLYPDMVDIQFLDSADNDPHLFDKAQFNYQLANGDTVAAQVIEFLPPKADRVGRLAYQGTVSRDGKQVNQMVEEFMVGVPDTKGELTIAAAMSALDEAADALTDNYGDKLEAALRAWAEWSVDHK